MRVLTTIWNAIQGTLFPHLEETVGPLTAKDQELVEVVELMEIDQHLKSFRWKGEGCPPHDRCKILIAFIAKAVHNFPTTRVLLDNLTGRPTLRRLCGWEHAGAVPSESTFSRAFAEFARAGVLESIHRAMIEKHCGSRLIGHVSRDSTKIEGREKPVKKEKAKKKADPAVTPKKRGRPRQDEPEAPKPPKRLEVQPTRTLEENLADLPRLCDVGCKTNSKGHKEWWVGFKLHIDTIDGDIPASAILTSASLHDSQVAIPLAQTTDRRITSLYDLMDAAYDAKAIHEFSRGLGHVPLIDHKPSRGEAKRAMDPHRAVRFRERSAAERVNSNLLDNYGGRFVRVRGAAKVMTHLMCGLIAVAATQLFELVT